MSNEKIDPQENEHLVITPGGPRPKNRVHVVPPGSAVLFGDDGKSAGAPVPETAHHLQPRTTSMADDLVLTPGGYRPRSTVHLVQPGHSVHHKGRLPHTAALVPRAANEAARASIPPGPPTTSNWISYAGWLNTTGNTITSFRTTWVVPPVPTTQASQLLYLFNGIEPADGSVILQPVLQWGDSGADEDGVQRTGPFWTIASWSVGADAHHTPHVPVNPGDVLLGVMTLIGQSGGTSSYSCEFQGIAGTNLSLTNSPELVWCVQTLEAYELQSTATPPYDLNSASEYPATATTAFRAIGVQTGTVNPSTIWLAQTQVSNFGEHAVVVNNSSTDGEVDIFYKS